MMDLSSHLTNDDRRLEQNWVTAHHTVLFERKSSSMQYYEATQI